MKVYEILIEAFSPRMKEALIDLIKILSDNDVKYIIGGANALSIWSKHPRTTIDIDAFVDFDFKKILDDKMLDNGFKLVTKSNFHTKFSKYDVEIDLLYSGSNDEDWAIANASEVNILGVEVLSTSPEGLLLLYLNSDKLQNFVDAVELVKSVDIDYSKIEGLLTDSTLEVLERVKKEADKIVKSRFEN